MTTLQHAQVYAVILFQCRDGEVKPGIFSQVAQIFSVDDRTISRIWREINKNFSATPQETGQLPSNECYKNKANKRGSKRKYDRDELKAAVRDIPLNNWRTWKWLSHESAILKTVLCNIFKDGGLRWHLSSLKPFLTEQNKLATFLHAIKEINSTTVNSRRGGIIQKHV